jgi:hypothetical protein
MFLFLREYLLDIIKRQSPQITIIMDLRTYNTQTAQIEIQ